jgi:NADP-dependent 3-hydroxy acid dehydrogenase YdfG
MNTDTTKKQVAIVTGTSSGIDMGITQALLQHSNRVVANSRNISKSKDLKPSSDLTLVVYQLAVLCYND